VAALLLYVISTADMNGHAQEKAVFSGRVSDASNGEALLAANIRIKEDFSTGTMADLDGHFRMELDAGTYTFVISYIGMQSQDFSVSLAWGEEVFKEFALEPLWQELEGVEIRVSKFEKPIEEVTVSMQVIKPILVENRNTRNIQSVLDLTPGLNILDNEPQIRGGSGFTFGVGSKVAILIDDMPMTSGEAGRPYWDLIPVENIEHIEVIKGASSVLSGTSALSGSIHIMTAQPTSDPVNKFTAYTGFYSAPKDRSMKWWDDYPYITGFSFLHSKKYGNLDLVLGGNADFDHGYLGAPLPGQLVVDTISNFTDKQMRSRKYRFNFGLKKHSIKHQGLNYGIKGNFMRNEAPMNLAWLDDSSGFYRGYPGAVYLQEQFIFYLDPFVNVQTASGTKHSLRVRVLNNGSDMTNNQSVNSTLIFGDYMFKRSYSFIKDFELIGGMSWTQVLVTADMYKASGSAFNKQYNISAYFQAENKIREVISTSIGIRGEYFELNDSISALKPIFRAGINFKMTPGTFLRFSFGQGFRFPSITERYIRTSAGSFAVFDNPYLEPESSWNLEVGLKQLFKYRNFYGYLDLAGFIQEYDNTIEYLFGFWDTSFALAGFKFLNTGRSQVTGLDLSMTGAGKMGRNSGIRTMAGYNYILPKTLEPNRVFAVDGRNIEYSYVSTSVDPSDNILKYRFLHTIKADIEFYTKYFSVGYTLKYFSRIVNLDKAIEEFEKATESTGGTMQPIRYMDYFYEHNNGNVVMDLRIAVELKGRHKISLISNNFLNRWYSLSQQYPSFFSVRFGSLTVVVFQYFFPSVKVHIGWCNIVLALMVSVIVVMIHKGSNLSFFLMKP
jgi:iron complex outermembrane receptor protein